MKKLAYKELIFKIDRKFPRFKTTDELRPCEGIIGQDRAINAISVGLDMRQEGYNIFISGMSGTGRSTTIKQLLDKMAKSKKTELKDKVFVYNFKHPEQPVFLELQAGDGNRLKKHMHNLVQYFKKKLPALLEDDEYKRRKRGILIKYDKLKDDFIQNFEDRARDQGFEITEIQDDQMIRAVILPVIDGKPVDLSVFEEKVQKGEIDADELEKLKLIQKRLNEDFQKVLEKITHYSEKAETKIEKLIRMIIEPKITSYISNIQKMFNDDKLMKYFDSITGFILEYPEIFLKNEETDHHDFNKAIHRLSRNFYFFDINIIVDNSETTSLPVIIENTPMIRNLFGTIESNYDQKSPQNSGFMDIKAGSLIKADGGYLVLDAEDMANDPDAYHILRRALKTQQHIIQPLEHQYLYNTSTLKPEPIPLNVKVILIGSESLYDVFNYIDGDFSKIFKIKAQFDSEIDNTLENQKKYGSFIKMLCDKENLRPLSFKAFEQVLRFSSRLTGNRQKLSTLFTNIADIIRESDYFAGSQNAGIIEDNHVRKAVEEREYRYNLLKEKMLDLIDLDIILINIEDSLIGQINALVVQSSGDISFGMPARITVSTSMGEQGIVNIEREAELSGSFFDKAVLIIDGYLRKIFAQDKPLSVNVSLAFEQSYGEVEGDSASQAEIIAILSSLSDIPIKQYLAITGSVNQLGEIQTIGGVNEKIEGFFDVCKMRGLKKGQGVIIPSRNINEINLKDEVMESIKKGHYDVWAVDRVEESVEIMMGVPAGKLEQNGYFTPGSAYDISNKKLWEYAKTWKKWSNVD